MAGEAVALSALAIMATIVASLVWLLKKLYTQNETTVRDNSKSTSALATAISRLADASEEQIKASKTRDEEQRAFQEHVISQLASIHANTGQLVEALPETVTQRNTKRR